jgi:hypothetical protein
MYFLVPSAITYQNLIQEEIKIRLNSGYACYNSIQNHFSSRLLSNNVTIRIYRTIILSVVLFWCETWSLYLREEHRLSVFEDRVLRRIFGPKRDEVKGGWRKLRNVNNSNVILQSYEFKSFFDLETKEENLLIIIPIFVPNEFEVEVLLLFFFFYFYFFLFKGGLIGLFRDVYFKLCEVVEDKSKIRSV